MTGNNPIESVDIDLKLIVNNVDAGDVIRKLQHATDQIKNSTKKQDIEFGGISSDKALEDIRALAEKLKKEKAALGKGVGTDIKVDLSSQIRELGKLASAIESVIKAQVKSQATANKNQATKAAITIGPSKELFKEHKANQVTEPKSQDVNPLFRKKFEESQDVTTKTPKQQTEGIITYEKHLSDLIAKNKLLLESDKLLNEERIRAKYIVSSLASEVDQLNRALASKTGNTKDSLSSLTQKQRDINRLEADRKEAITKVSVANRKATDSSALSSEVHEETNTRLERYIHNLKVAITESIKLANVEKSLKDLGANVFTEKRDTDVHHLAARLAEAEFKLAQKNLVENTLKKSQDIDRSLKSLPNSSLDANERFKAANKLKDELIQLELAASKSHLFPEPELANLRGVLATTRAIVAELEKASHVPAIALATTNLSTKQEALDKFKSIRESGIDRESSSTRLANDQKELVKLNELIHAQKALAEAEDARYAKEKAHFDTLNQAHIQGSSRGAAPAQPTPINPAFRTNIDENLARVNQLHSAIDGLDVVFNRVAQGAGLFLRYAVVYKALGAITSFIGGAVSELVGLDKQLVSIKAIGNATTSEMDTISASILRIGENSAFTTTEVAKAAETLVQAGVKMNKLGEVLKSVADLAAATGATMQQTAELTSTFIAVYKEVSPDEIADSLKSAVNISKLSISDLSTIGNYLLSTGQAFNEGYKDILAVSATLRNAGIKASTIATGSRQALLELLNPDEKALKGLKARYLSLGKDISTDTIKALFQGFKGARDPLQAALAELEQLGLDKLGDKELSRIFDVRSTNVIRTLVQQQNELKSNRIALDDAGSAAEGAKTQLESLSASASNLREVLVGGLFQSSESFISQAAKQARDLTHSLEGTIKKFREIKAETGSTGILPAVGGGAAAAIGALLSRKSVGTSLAIGAVATGASIAGTTSGDDGKGVLPDAAKGIEIAGSIYGAWGLLKLLGKAGSNLLGTKAILANGDTAAVAADSLGKVKNLVTAIRLAIVGVGALTAGPIIAAVVGAGAIIALYYKALHIKAVDTKEDLEGKLTAIASGISEKKANIDELKKLGAIAKSKDVTAKAFGDSIKDLYDSIDTLVGGKANDLVKELINNATIATKSIGSAALENLALQVEAITKQPVDRSALATALQKRDAALAVGEGLRKQTASGIAVAKSKVQGGTASEGDKLTANTFDSASKEDQALLLNPITTQEASTKLHEFVKKFAEVFKAASDSAVIAEKLAGNEKGTIEDHVRGVQDILAKLEGDKATFDRKLGTLAVLYGKRYSKPKEELITELKKGLDTSSKEDMAGLQAKAIEQVNLGAIEIVEAMVKAAKGNLDSALVSAAKNNRKEIESAPIRKLLADTQDRIAAPKAGDTSLTDYVKKPLETPIVNENKQVLEHEVEVKRKEIESTAKYILKQLDIGRTKESLSKIYEGLEKTQAELADKNNKLSSMKEGEIEAAGTTEELNRSLILSQSKLKAAQDVYANSQETKLKSVKEEVDMLREVAAIKRKQLKLEKEMLTKQLILALKDEGIDAKGATPEELNKLLETQKGQELVTKSAGVAEKYKGLLDIVDKEKMLREENVKELNNIKARSDQRNLADAKEKLNHLESNTKGAESNLNAVTQRLSDARQNLADSYAKQADLESFFNSALSGAGAKVSKGDLSSQLMGASADQAKSVAEQAQAAQSAGSISASDAKGIIEDARTQAMQAQSQEIDANTSAVVQLQNQQNFYVEAVNSNIISQNNLQASIDRLTVATENSGNAEGRATGLLKEQDQLLSDFSLQANPRKGDAPVDNNSSNSRDIAGFSNRGDQNWFMNNTAIQDSLTSNKATMQPVQFVVNGQKLNANADSSNVESFKRDLEWENAKSGW